MAKTLDRGLENREIVLDILMEVLEQGVFVHLVLDQALQRYQCLGKVDRSFITRAVEGTLEYLIQIDEVINRYSKTKINKMKLFIRSPLWMSVYQISYMGRVPDSIVCNEAVKMAVKRHFFGLKGFANGVLRTIPREKENLTFDTSFLWYGIPEWICVIWEKEFGKEKAERIAASFLEDKPTWVRCSLHRADRESILASLKAQGTSARELSFMESMIVIDGYDYLEGPDVFRKGWIQVQDVTSALVGEIASPEKDSYIIDVCVAPRGKSLHLAGKLEGVGMVEARNLTYQEIVLIEENTTRCGMINTKTLVWDALETGLSAMVKADIVTAGLLYSGLGIIGRKPDIKYNMTPEKLEEPTGLQREIPSVVWQYIKPGGFLCYSICTVDRLESQDNAVWLRDRFPFVPVDLTGRFGGLSQKLSLKDGWIQSLSGVYPYNGLFINVSRCAEDETGPERIQSVFWKESLCWIYWTATEKKI